MNWHFSQRGLGAVIVLAGILLCSNVTAAGLRTVDMRKPVDPDGDVEIGNVAGRVEVTGWDRSEIEVTGTIGDQVERVDLNTSERHATVRVVLPEHSGPFGDGSAELVVHVPRKSLLMASGVSADLTTRGLLGEQQLHTISGSIDGDLAREGRVDTVSGTVRLKSSAGAGPLEVKSVSGAITVDGATGEIRVGTVSGDTRLTLGSVTRARFQSVSGSLTVSGVLASGGELEAQTVSGSLRLTVTGTADYDIESFSGSIDNCFGPKAQRPEHGPGTQLAFREGDGNGRVRLSTHSGSIQLCDHP